MITATKDSLPGSSSLSSASSWLSVSRHRRTHIYTHSYEPITPHTHNHPHTHAHPTDTPAHPPHTHTNSSHPHTHIHKSTRTYTYPRPSTPLRHPHTHHHTLTPSTTANPLHNAHPFTRIPTPAPQSPHPHTRTLAPTHPPTHPHDHPTPTHIVGHIFVSNQTSAAGVGPGRTKDPSFPTDRSGTTAPAH